MHHYKVEMGGFESWMWADQGNLSPVQQGWTQQPAHWTLFFFEHAGMMTVNNRPIPYEDGNVGFVAPGTKVAFDRTGEDTAHYAFTFGLVSRTETVTIPAVASLGDLVEVRRREVAASYEWLHVSIMRGLACCFNLLWSISKPIDAFRKSDLVFDAETLIAKRIGGKIVVQDLADELAISHSHLLRLFRQDHHCTIQEYIRDKRVEIASHLITTTNLSLKEIARRSGIPDLQYFNKVIRTSSGLSPTALREQALRQTRH